MNNPEDLSNFITHLMRGGSDIAPLIEEYGMVNILNQLAEYSFNECICSNFAGDEGSTWRWLTTDSLLKKAAELWVSEKTPEPITPLHSEAINRFLIKLPSNERQALGIPPQLRVEVSIGTVTPSGAEFYKGWYQPWDKCFSEKLVIVASSYEHCLALRLGLKSYLEAARGLFRGLDFESGGCRHFGCAVTDS